MSDSETNQDTFKQITSEVAANELSGQHFPMQVIGKWNYIHHYKIV